MDHAVCAQLCTQAAVRMITLTGSLHAGQQVLEYAKAHMARCSLELGGKTPAVVLADADLDRAAADIVRSRLNHCGQVCTAVERVLVDQRVHDALLARVRQAMSAVDWGDRSVQPQRMGPLVSAAARERVHAMVRRAVDEGATLEAGGVVPDGPGFFYPPTLLSGCKPTMEIVREEVFGPVLAVLAVDGADEALRLANDHQYGLSSVLYTHDHALAQRFAAEIEAGELYINRTPADPYQGYHAGWRRSGVGGDDGKHGMLAFTQTRLVVMPY
jgi:lactaldehyde dehydrogenase/glycolaldehyde dehydrogenase